MRKLIPIFAFTFFAIFGCKKNSFVGSSPVVSSADNTSNSPNDSQTEPTSSCELSNSCDDSTANGDNTNTMTDDNGFPNTVTNSSLLTSTTTQVQIGAGGYSCKTQKMKAIGARGGTGAFGSPGEKLYAALLLPTNAVPGSDLYVLEPEIADFRYVDAGSTMLVVNGQLTQFAPRIGPFKFQAGIGASFSATINQRPSSNAETQFLNVWYQIEYMATSPCGGM